MACAAGSVRLGGEYNRERLYASVCMQTTPLRQGGDVSGVRPEGPGAVDGNPLAPCQTGDRGGTPELRKSGFNSQ